MLPSEKYVTQIKRHYVFNIMPISNITSLVKYGLLSYNMVKGKVHISIAMNDVQERRSKVEIPNGRALHDYANMYFDFNNPMLYSRKNIAEEICILAIKSEVMDIEGCVLSDRNAARSLARFYQPIEGINRIDFKKVFDKYWTNGNDIENMEHKGIKCAEILVPDKVNYEYVTSACVLNNDAKQRMLNNGFNKKIVINSKVFYR